MFLLGSLQTKSNVTPLSEQNFILRGCSLKNTKYIYGLVSYTG